MLYDIPSIAPVTITPTTAWAEYRQISHSPGRPIHFYRTALNRTLPARWASRVKDVELLRAYPFVVPQVAPLTQDTPLAHQIASRYITMQLCAYYQQQGLTVVAPVQYTSPEHLPILLEGIPKHTTIAIESHAPLSKWYKEAQAIIDALAPQLILVHGPVVSSVPWDTPTYIHTHLTDFTRIARRAPGTDARTRYLLGHRGLIAYWIRRYHLELHTEDATQHIIAKSLELPCKYDPAKSSLCTYASRFVSMLLRNYLHTIINQPRLGLIDIATDGHYPSFAEPED